MDDYRVAGGVEVRADSKYLLALFRGDRIIHGRSKWLAGWMPADQALKQSSSERVRVPGTAGKIANALKNVITMCSASFLLDGLVAKFFIAEAMWPVHFSAQKSKIRVGFSTGQDRFELTVDLPQFPNLAHIGQRQRRGTRYCGLRKNSYNLRRAAAIQNLKTVQRNAA